MKRKSLIPLLCLGFAFVIFSGCESKNTPNNYTATTPSPSASVSPTAETGSSPSPMPEETPESAEATVRTGKVTVISGNDITVALGKLNESELFSSGSDASASPSPSPTPGPSFGPIVLDGRSVVFTVTPTTKIKAINEAGETVEAEMSDIQLGDIVSVRSANGGLIITVLYSGEAT
jgi:hypothetical protein